MNPVRGAGRIAALCVRCLVVLTIVNVPVVLLGWLVHSSLLSFALAVYPGVVVTAAVPIAVVGFPAGLLVSHLMRRELDERRHVAVFAVTGAALSVAICATTGTFYGPAAWLVVVGAAAEGAVGAGGARWWSGRPRRARTALTDEEVEDAAVSRALDA